MAWVRDERDWSLALSKRWYPERLQEQGSNAVSMRRSRRRRALFVGVGVSRLCVSCWVSCFFSVDCGGC